MHRALDGCYRLGNSNQLGRLNKYLSLAILLVVRKFLEHSLVQSHLQLRSIFLVCTYAVLCFLQGS